MKHEPTIFKCWEDYPLSVTFWILRFVETLNWAAPYVLLQLLNRSAAQCDL